MMIDDVPLDGLNADDVEKSMKGGPVPKGKYHARLDGVADVTSKAGTPGTELTFTVMAGANAGNEVKETVWTSENEKAKNRVVLFASRLGLLNVDPKTKKYIRVEGKHTFQDCLGAEVVIEVDHREYAKKDGSKGHAAQLTFGGIWRLDDKEVKDVAKAKASAKPAATTKPTPKPIDVSGV